MNANTTIRQYANYVIEIKHDERFSDYSFIVKNQSDEKVIQSRRGYDSVDDAFIRACLRINDEL